MAVEAQAIVAVVGFRVVALGGGYGFMVVIEAGTDAGQAFVARDGGLGVEGYAFEELAALEAGEAGGVEALGSGANDAAGYWEGTRCALGLGAMGVRCRGPVSGRFDRGSGGVVGKRTVGG